MRNAVGAGTGHCDSMSADLRRSERVALCHVDPNDASPHDCPRSPSRRRSPSTPRPRRCRRRARPSSASAPASPTSRRPAHIVEAAVAACRDPKNHRYSPAGGLPELKEAIALKTKRDSGFDFAAAQVLVTNGGKHAVYTAFAALCDPGDEVICPAPYWTTYPEAITLAGGVPVVIETTEETGFQVTVDQLEAACTERTKVLLFVSPDNPSGAVYPPEQVAAIGQWAVERGVWVITDEIYEHLTYGPHEFSSMPVLVPDLADQCIIVNGVAKTYAMTGWRVGWMIAPAGRHQGGDELPEPRHVERRQRRPSAPPSPRSAATSRRSAMMRDAFERRGRLMHSMLSAIDGVTCLEPQGAFYCFPNVDGPARPGHPRPHVHDEPRARRPRAVGGQGGVRARRGVRRARATPASRSPSATTTSPRASPASPTSPPPDPSVCCTECWRRGPPARQALGGQAGGAAGGCRRRGRWRRTPRRVSGITDSRLPRASSWLSASSGIVRRTSSGTNRLSGRTGATVTQSHRGSSGFEPGS